MINISSEFIEINNEIKKILNENIEKVLLSQSEKLEEFIKLIMNSNNIVFTGSGRSGYYSAGDGMRLGHIITFLKGSVKVFFIEDTNVPYIGENDLLIVISGSGETGSQYDKAKIAVEAGAKVVLLSSYVDSEIARIAYLTIEIPGRILNRSESILKLGTIFEMSADKVLAIIYGVICKRYNISDLDLKKIHTNLK